MQMNDVANSLAPPETEKINGGEQVAVVLKMNGAVT